LFGLCRFYHSSFSPVRSNRINLTFLTGSRVFPDAVKFRSRIVVHIVFPRCIRGGFLCLLLLLCCSCCFPLSDLLCGFSSFTFPSLHLSSLLSVLSGSL